MAAVSCVADIPRFSEDRIRVGVDGQAGPCMGRFMGWCMDGVWVHGGDYLLGVVKCSVVLLGLVGGWEGMGMGGPYTWSLGRPWLVMR